MMHVIIKEKLFDESYVTSRTVGLDDIRKWWGNTLPKSWKNYRHPEDLLIKAARLYASAKASFHPLRYGHSRSTSAARQCQIASQPGMLCGNVESKEAE